MGEISTLGEVSVFTISQIICTARCFPFVFPSVQPIFLSVAIPTNCSKEKYRQFQIPYRTVKTLPRWFLDFNWWVSKQPKRSSFTISYTKAETKQRPGFSRWGIKIKISLELISTSLFIQLCKMLDVWKCNIGPQLQKRLLSRFEQQLCSYCNILV